MVKLFAPIWWINKWNCAELLETNLWREIRRGKICFNKRRGSVWINRKIIYNKYIII